MTGQTHHHQIIVFGEGLHVIMSPSMLLHCELQCTLAHCIQASHFMLIKTSNFHFSLFWFAPIFFGSNLSGLNLDGEISPAIGNLKSLVSMYFLLSFRLFLFPFVHSCMQ